MIPATNYNFSLSLSLSLSFFSHTFKIFETICLPKYFAVDLVDTYPSFKWVPYSRWKRDERQLCICIILLINPFQFIIQIHSCSIYNEIIFDQLKLFDLFVLFSFWVLLCFSDSYITESKQLSFTCQKQIYFEIYSFRKEL